MVNLHGKHETFWTLLTKPPTRVLLAFFCTLHPLESIGFVFTVNFNPQTNYKCVAFFVSQTQRILRSLFGGGVAYNERSVEREKNRHPNATDNTDSRSDAYTFTAVAVTAQQEGVIGRTNCRFPRITPLILLLLPLLLLLLCFDKVFAAIVCPTDITIHMSYSPSQCTRVF